MSSFHLSDPINETYEETKGLLLHHVTKYVKKYSRYMQKFSIQFDDLMSEAHLAWMDTYRLYDPTRGRFSTLLIWAVQHRLTKYYRILSATKRKPPQQFPEYSDGRQMEFAEEIEHRIDLSGISEDAQLIISVLNDSNILDVVHFLCAPNRNKSNDCLIIEGELKTWHDVQNSVCGGARAWRWAIREHLKDLGWSARRINKGWEEIREALCN